MKIRKFKKEKIHKCVFAEESDASFDDLYEEINKKVRKMDNLFL